jgi:hypothetical protein
MIDNERRERQFFAFRLLAQFATQGGKSHRINATTDSEAFVSDQPVCSALQGDVVCNSHRTNVRPRQLAEPLLREISFQ